MTTALNLNTQELVLLHTLLEVRAADLGDYIHDTNYIDKFGLTEAEAILRADTRYLADIRDVQAKINAAI